MFGRLVRRGLTPLTQRETCFVRSFAKKAKGGKGGKAAEDASDAVDITEFVETTPHDVQKNMRGAVANYIKILSAMRPGHANAGIFDTLKVSAYGQMASLSQLAQVSVVGTHELAVTVYDPSLLQDIRKGIEDMNPSFTVQPSGSTLDVRFPKMTKETRDELIKAAKKQAEAARQHIRRVRQDGMHEMKKLKGVSEDDIKVEQDKIQKLTDDHMAEIGQLLTIKEKDLSAI
ncbi:unnamed protein product [Aphanomyces euteiches]